MFLLARTNPVVHSNLANLGKAVSFSCAHQRLPLSLTADTFNRGNPGAVELQSVAVTGSRRGVHVPRSEAPCKREYVFRLGCHLAEPSRCAPVTRPRFADQNTTLPRPNKLIVKAPKRARQKHTFHPIWLRWGFGPRQWHEPPPVIQRDHSPRFPWFHLLPRQRSPGSTCLPLRAT